MAVILALARSLLLAQEPERAHMRALAWTSRLQATGLLGRMVRTPAPFPSRVFGLDFPNPVGLAAGLDKDGAHVDALFALGFGFVEVGTVTPLPQPGNPQPRLFRLPEHQAVINRMGFNNAGVEQLARNIEASRFARAALRQGVLGINIGKNKDTPNAQAAQDYLTCLERVYPLADYVTVNISSPNTAGLRELQEEQSLRRLVETLQEARERLSTRHGRQVPVLVKISPDLSDFDIDAVARVFNDTRVDGVIATNTTIARGEVQGSPLADEQGGLSGEPLLERSTATLRRLRSRMDETIPIIGVGGVTRGADAVAKTAAGAALVQVYTGLIYRGPRLVRECVDAIRRRKVARASGTAALK